MAVQPPGGPSAPTPPPFEDPKGAAANLRSCIQKFSQQTQEVLDSPGIVDNPDRLADFANTVKALNDAAQTAINQGRGS